MTGTRRDMMTKARRFFFEVVVSHEGDDCLIWPFAKTDKGYGYITYKGRRTTVNNAVCEEAYGPCPADKDLAAHSCRNTSCCNKQHLRWATHGENQDDRVRDETSNRGERCAQAVLDQQQVKEIRALQGKSGQRAVARQFGISPSSVFRIWSRETWGWLE